MGLSGKTASVEIIDWLRQGGRVVAASARAARAIAAGFHRAQQDQGLKAWPTPAVQDWNAFVHAEWERLAASDEFVLNPMQEEALWAEIARQSRRSAALLEPSRYRLAALSSQAHALLCAYAPRCLDAGRRAGWPADAGVFSEWLTHFDEACRARNAIAAARLPLTLLALLEQNQEPRPPLLLAGFDRILPAQRAVLDAWGQWRQAPLGEPCQDLAYYAASDPRAELQACALWLKTQLAANPSARLLVIAQDAALRRGEIERAFRAHSDAGAPASFEFSLGEPLAKAALPRGASLLLQWLDGPLSEPQLDWLLAAGQCAASDEETLTLQGYMRLLRRRGLERTQWRLREWIEAIPGALPAAWTERILQAKSHFDAHAAHAQSPAGWAEFAAHALKLAGWPGGRTLSSLEFQQAESWRGALDLAASLAFDGRRIGWTEFLALLGRALDSTLFAPESEQAPTQIVGLAESAGLSADAVWVLGADELSWPAAGAAHPFLPLAVQREAGMPFADPLLDYELAESALRRLAGAAGEIRFSYSLHNEQAEGQPAKLVAQLAGAAQPLPAALRPPTPPAPATIPVEEPPAPAFPPGAAPGGAAVLTAQSQCPFRAFAATRLSAQGWEPAQPCLTAAERGQLLHLALHAIWSGPPEGVGSSRELLEIENLSVFVRKHAAQAMRGLPVRLRANAPRRYLELEEERLCGLLEQWLLYEAARQPFSVEAAEIAKPVAIAGLSLNLRLDRIDRLADGSLLVVDYKTGLVKPSSWELPRPDDVQLPLYAAFGLDPDEQVGGLAFAKLRQGELEFTGRLFDARATLFEDLRGQSALVKKPLDAATLDAWRAYIEKLAQEFLEGKAAVDPRQPPATCARCNLQSLCRIQENAASQSEAVEEEDEDE